MRCLLLSIALLQFIHSSGQLSRVKIKLTPEKHLFALARLGLDVSHGEYEAGRYFIGEFSKSEMAILKSTDFETEILIPNIESWLLKENSKIDKTHLTKTSYHCDYNNENTLTKTPSNFKLGSMGGYYTYDELLTELDSMAAKFPHLISVRSPIDTFLTHEGRPLYWLRLSDHPEQDEDEPEILFTALHHAREPIGLSQLIYYMWYLLENYETNEEIQYLINQTELYFIPCVNPDGYIYNQTTHPNGGGNWRKNRRDNGDGTFGVDLNRNYGYKWASDNMGSSAMTGSYTYRGAHAFSEPETQAVSEFCKQHEFQIALNYHTYGNMLIYPWGFSGVPTSEGDRFKAIGEALTLENKFKIGTGTETIGYLINGGSDDWMYGQLEEKPAIYAFTPEVGSSFWHPARDIERLCRSTLEQNLMACRLLHLYGKASDVSPDYVRSKQGSLAIHFKKYGLDEGDLKVSLLPISSNILVTDASKVYNLDENETLVDTFGFVMDTTVENGTKLLFELVVSNDSISWRDTLTKTYANLQTAFKDSLTHLDHWQINGTWDLTSQTFFSPPSSIALSPNGNYRNYANFSLTTKDTFDLSEASVALLSFRAKWDIEKDWDYVQVQISVNGQAFVPLCGKYTQAGSGNLQPKNQPLYEGKQDKWVLEEINLLPYLGTTLNTKAVFRFIFRSNPAYNGQGFFLDDVEVSIAKKTIKKNVIIPKLTVQLQNLNLFTIYPNPVINMLNIASIDENLKTAQVELTHSDGKSILNKTVTFINGKATLELPALQTKNPELLIVKIKNETSMDVYKIIRE